MKLFDKVKWVSGVLLVFVIVLATNLIDKDNFNRLKNSITTIYEDRIVASDLLFEIALLVHEKELALASNDSTFTTTRNEAIFNQIEAYLTRYEETKLTTEEQNLFNGLKENLQQFSAAQNRNTQLQQAINSALQNLSKIQVDEGHRQMKMSTKTMESINLFTQIEVIFLVIIAILVQVIILYKPKN